MMRRKRTRLVPCDRELKYLKGQPKFLKSCIRGKDCKYGSSRWIIGNEYFNELYVFYLINKLSFNISGNFSRRINNSVLYLPSVLVLYPIAIGLALVSILQFCI